MKILVICGTRPEAIKLAPLILKLRTIDGVSLKLCTSGQHRGMMSEALDLFDLKPDDDLAVMRNARNLGEVTSAILNGHGPIFSKWKPDLAIVHGDTNTALAASLAALYAGVPVAHVEAGLRTGNMQSPFPEEANRRIVGVLAQHHYAPMGKSRQNLIAENLPSEKVVVTGNTVIDALLLVVNMLECNPTLAAETASALPAIDSGKKLIVVTGHRRENFGEGFDHFCQALVRLAEREDVRIIFPVHLNPKAREPVQRTLGSIANVTLTEPLQYLPFVALMKQAYMIISDSGGIQEEAPALGVPALVTRDTTERPAALEAGTIKLVGTSTGSILREANLLLDDTGHYQMMSSARNPFGDGTACEKIIEDLVP